MVTYSESGVDIDLEAVTVSKLADKLKSTLSCRDIITEAGYGEYYIHGTGHGVGTEVHEPPTLNSRSDEILQENQAVTVEPGIYLPDKFGVRIEDLAIVTSFGIINCTRSTKELIVL